VQGEAAPVGAVLSRHPELRATKSLVLDLANEEYCQRLEAGEKIDPDEFIGRFPAYKTSVRKLLETHQFFEEKIPLLEAPDPSRVSWPQAGQLFLGFSLLEELGRGAFARVFLAAEPALGNRLVAVKVSLQGTAEAETLGRLHHRNIVPVHSAQKDEKTVLNVVCMSFLGSATLCDVLDHLYAQVGIPNRAKTILDGIRSAEIPGYPPIDSQPPARVYRQGTYVDGVLHIALQLAEALQFIHAQGICHRDLKPSNVLLTPDGRPMLLDFNLSFDEQVTRLQVGGTYPYMAPEHLRVMDPENPGNPTLVDERSDMFSLGVILYELLTVKHPFAPSSLKLTLEEMRQYLLERQREGARPITEVNPRLDKALGRLIDRCIANDPSHRPQTAAELVAAFRKCLSRWRQARRWAALHARRLLLAGTLGAVSTGALVYWAVPKEPYSIRQLHKGLEDYRRGRYQEALNKLSEAIRADPENVEAYFARGRAFQQLDDIESAFAAYEKAYQLNPDGKTAACMAYCLGRIGFYKEAIAYSDEAISRGISTAPVLNNRGYDYLKLHNVSKAEKDLAEAERLDASFQAIHYNRALLELLKTLHHKNEKTSIQQGVASFRKALESGPDTADLNFYASQLCAYASIRDKTYIELALDYLARAIELGFDPRKIKDDIIFQALQADPRFIALCDSPAPTSPPGQPGDAALRLLDPAADEPDSRNL
jgi:serine/threonine protein kinase/Tfp pilus assembly protein PilF